MMANQGTYDVFLSFRGEVRHSFVGFLYDALCRKGFHTFMDDEGLRGGNEISQSLANAIEQSRISIVILSGNYATSRWCLDELIKILKCMRLRNQLVWPIFYKVEPSDVRHQRNSYWEPMTAHEERFGSDSEKVQKWRSALSEVASLKGWHIKTGYEYHYIQEIVNEARVKLHREELCDCEHIIGHQSRIEEVKLLLDIESCNMVYVVGIHGAGGTGKTTLAKGIYNLIVGQFEFALFLEAVREKSSYMGLQGLQETILSKLYDEKNIKLGSVGEGAARLKDGLCRRRVLLVLDDFDSDDQLEQLAGNGDWFGSGSRIIITTRDKHVLNVCQVEKRYRMKELKYHEALQVFCWNAFNMSQPATTYEGVSNRAIGYANGLPLALKVIGSNLVGKSVEECECALEQYDRIPDKKIQDILKISYDCLGDNAKNIFLDIACFFKGCNWDYVKKAMERCDFFPAYNIGILVNKSLLTIEYDCLRMHDLIQDMGREIVRQEAASKPGDRSRLYSQEDVLRVLTQNSGSNNIEGIMLDRHKKEGCNNFEEIRFGPPKKVEWSGTAFEKMNNLRILIVRHTHFSSRPKYLPNSLRWLEWEWYPSESLPPDLFPSNLVYLSLPDSRLGLQKEKALPKMVHLTCINFSSCDFVTHLPDMSGVPNLRKLDLRCCKNLIVVHHSVGFLEKLEYLDSCACTKLEELPSRVRSPSLQYLNLYNTRIAFFPDIEKRVDKPSRLSLGYDRIKELPDSIGNLIGLKSISVTSCVSLRGLPSALFMLPAIEEICLDVCPKVGGSFTRILNSHAVATSGHSNLYKPRYSPLRCLVCSACGLTNEDLQAIVSYFPNLEELDVSYNGFGALPIGIKESAKLNTLGIGHCVNLKEIPELPPGIRTVHANNCPSLSSKASSMLWSTALNEVDGLYVNMPQSPIPDWFHHRREGGSLSFWVRGNINIPALALAFIWENKRPVERGSIRAYINGVCARGYGGGWGDDVMLFNILDPSTGPNPKDMNYYLLLNILPITRPNPKLFLSEWNYVKFQYNTDEIKKKLQYNEFDEGHVDVSGVVCCGAYVYKKNGNMEDIRFKRPNPSDPPNKSVKKLKTESTENHNTKARRRRSIHFQTWGYSRRRVKMLFPMTKCFWRFLSNGFRVYKKN